MTVDSAMDRIAAADDSRHKTADRDQQHEMYRKTLRALADIEPDDDDEGVAVVADWIVDQLDRTEDRPSSKDVRRRAREFCRANDYEVPDDSWLRS